MLRCISAQLFRKQTMAGQKMKVLAVLVLCCIAGARSAELVTKCKSEDSKCAKASTLEFTPKFVAGLPDLGVKPLDPVSYKKIDASSPNLKLILTDVTVIGLKDCQAKKVKRDRTKKKLFLKLQCTAQLEGQYEMDGKLLVLPIQGKGPLHVTLRKAEINVDVDIGEIEKDGEIYWDITSWKHDYSLKDKSDVVFENLFNGNEILAQAAREVIAVSGNDIILEVGPPVVKTVVDDVIENVKTFFHKVPSKELSLD